MTLPEQPDGAPPPIYLDYQATTPLDPRVLDAMLPYLTSRVGNPHSSTHQHGREAMRAVEDARGQVAALIGAQPNELIFTSGATESNNMLIRGAAAAGARSGRNRVITCATEHQAVLKVAQSLIAQGHDLVTLSVDQTGLINPAAFTQAATDTLAVATIMTANNEIGVVQPIAALAELAHAGGGLFHSDAAQAVGKLAIDVAALGVDLMSLSAHKLYGPMGIGAAYIASRARRRIDPLILGGGQQGGHRSGTLPVALCVGFGEACRISLAEMAVETRRLDQYRADFLDILREEGIAFDINGAMAPRLSGNLNLSFAGVDAEALLMRTGRHLSISSGSACTTESLDPSHVVLALHVGRDRAESAVRISFGRMTTAEEVTIAARCVAKAVARLRTVSYTGSEG